MTKMRRTVALLAFVLALAMAAPLTAQTKKETKKYNAALKKDNVAAYEAFLQKFPESVYAADVALRRDTMVFDAVDKGDVVSVEEFIGKYPSSQLLPEAFALRDKLNTSALDDKEIASVVGKLVPDAAGSVATKIRNVETIFAFGKDSLYRLQQEGTEWKARAVPFTRYTFDQKLTKMTPEKAMSIVSIGSGRYLNFSYTNSADGSSEKEYVSSLLSLLSGEVASAMFAGRMLSGKLEGRSPETMSISTGLSSEVSWLLNSFRANSSLVEITKANEAADEAIGWWYGKNTTSGKARRLSFGVLEGENAIIDGMSGARTTARTSKWIAAWFNVRGNSVICAQDRSSGEYMLVWCEPVNTKGRAGRDLQKIYFESGSSTLDMVYYQGRTMFKQKINLSDKSFRLEK